LVNFGPLAKKKFKRLIFTHSKMNTEHGASANAIAFARWRC